MKKEIGQYKESINHFLCNDCFSKAEGLSREDYKPIYDTDFGTDIYTCDKCGKKEKRRTRNIFAKIIQIIGWFFLIIGGIPVLLSFPFEEHSHAEQLTLWIGLPLIITGLLLIFLVFFGKILSKNKILNLFFTILIIILIILVINFFWGILDIFNPIIKTRCERIKEQAINTNNPEKCSEIQAVPFISRDLSIFLFHNTEKYYLDRERKECISKIAISEEDIKVCEIIQKRGIGYRADYIYCVVDVAVATKNESICDEFNYSWCYHRVAVVKQDPALCEKIKSGDDRSSCYAAVAIARVDSSLCEKIIDKEDVYYLAKCYKEIAIIREDPDLCKKIPYVQYYTPQGDCYSAIARIAVKKREIDLCGRIQDPYYLSRCYTEIAVAENNPELCEKIPSQSEYYQDCLNKVGNK